jgi:hypothetical protein
MADRVENDVQVELSSSSNGQSSHSNLVNGRSRPAKPRRSRTNQAESSMSAENHHRHEEGNFLKFITDLIQHFSGRRIERGSEIQRRTCYSSFCACFSMHVSGHNFNARNWLFFAQRWSLSVSIFVVDSKSFILVCTLHLRSRLKVPVNYFLCQLEML